MNELIDEFLAYCEQRKSVNTVQAYKIDLTQFMRYISAKGIGISVAKPKDIDNFLLSLGRKRSSLGRKLACLSTFYKFLIKHGYVEYNPTLDVEKFKIPKHNPDYLTLDEINHLRLALVHNPWLLTIVEFMLTTGVRVSELCALDIRHVDLEKRQAVVTGKGDKQRIVIFSKNCAKLLSAYLSSRQDTDAALFIDKRGRIKRLSVYYRVRRLGEKFLGRRIHPHIFRHTFATHLLNSGINIKEVQMLLGHEDLQTTAIYVHPTPALQEHYDKAIQFIEGGE